MRWTVVVVEARGRGARETTTACVAGKTKTDREGEALVDDTEAKLEFNTCSGATQFNALSGACEERGVKAHDKALEAGTAACTHQNQLLPASSTSAGRRRCDQPIDGEPKELACISPKNRGLRAQIEVAFFHSPDESARFEI